MAGRTKLPGNCIRCLSPFPPKVERSRVCTDVMEEQVSRIIITGSALCVLQRLRVSKDRVIDGF